jgi:TfoX/Sxy family transcriptional regulator of competence genes
VAYDTELAERVRHLLMFEPDLAEKRMFGGIAFLIRGHIAVAVSSRGGLLMRVEEDETDAVLAMPYVEPFEMRGKTLRGWAHVAGEAVAENDDLLRWITTGADLARALPPKG